MSVVHDETKQRRIDIVIVNYKSTDLLLGCLNSIQTSARDVAYRVHVQDNSQDNDVDRAKKLFPWIELRKNRKNLGFARGVNRGLALCTAPYALLLNPDTFITPGFFESVLDYMDSHPDIGILGPAIFDADGSVQGSARGFPNLLTAFFGRRSVITKLFPDNPITRENIKTLKSDGVTPMDVDWVSGACMVVRLSSIKSVGALDERFFMYWEDADWCRRMWESGWRVVYFPQACITHFVGGSSERNVFRSVVSFHRSSYKLSTKYLASPNYFYKSIVFCGLILRCLFVLFYQLIRIGIQSVKRPVFLHEDISYGRVKIVILRFIARLNIGGPAIHVYILGRDVDCRRFETTLVAGRISPKEGDMGYLFHYLDQNLIFIPELQRDINPLMDILAFVRILRLLVIRKPDIVDTHTAKAGTTARIAAGIYNLFSKKKIRTVHTFHGHVFEGYFTGALSGVYLWIERLLALWTDVIIAISPSQKRDLTQKFHIASAQKVRNIPLGFDLSPYLTSAECKGRFRARNGISEGVVLVGIIGRLVPIKNHRLFVDATRVCIERSRGMPLRFCIVGDGEMRSDLERYCAELDMADYVIFTGWLRNLREVYADLDVLALTSDNEGTPMSVIEAMAASVPVISTDAGGVVDLLGECVTPFPEEGFSLHERGVMCPKRDVEGFSRGLGYLVRDHEAEKSRLTAAARVFVERQFSGERLIRDMEDLYGGLADHPGRVHPWSLAGPFSPRAAVQSSAQGR